MEKDKSNLQYFEYKCPESAHIRVYSPDEQGYRNLILAAQMLCFQYGDHFFILNTMYQPDWRASLIVRSVQNPNDKEDYRVFPVLHPQDYKSVVEARSVITIAEIVEKCGDELCKTTKDLKDGNRIVKRFAEVKQNDLKQTIDAKDVKT